jgi:ABC-type transporter Mla subunit MlaD
MNGPNQVSASDASRPGGDPWGSLGSHVEEVLRAAEQAAQHQLDEARRTADERVREALDEAQQLRDDAQRIHDEAQRLRDDAERDAHRQLEDAAANLEEAERLLDRAEERAEELLAEAAAEAEQRTEQLAEEPNEQPTESSEADTPPNREVAVDIDDEVRVSADDGLRMLVAGKGNARRQLRALVDELQAIVDQLDDEADLVIDLTSTEPSVVVTTAHDADRAGDQPEAEEDREPTDAPVAAPPIASDQQAAAGEQAGADEAADRPTDTASPPSPANEVRVKRTGDGLSVAIRSVVHRVVADVFSGPSRS